MTRTEEIRTLPLRDVIPRIIPYGWAQVETVVDGVAFGRGDGLFLIMSGCYEEDGKRWIHLSASRRDRIPSWEDLKDVKRLFLGREAMAVQVLPPESRYININPHVLHLWHCLDGDPCPDFARGGNQI